MEFKDATSAAHAAAEAAERASYAARAAAQLAREGSFTQQSPNKSHESHIRDEMPYNGSFNNRKSRNESNSSPKVTKSSSGSRSRYDSDKSSVNYDNHQEDRYSRKHEDQGPSPRRSSKKESEARFKRGDSRYDETDYDDDDQGSSSPEISSRQKSKAHKTSLKLATARIKLMRNKKGAQVIQMKKELAQLLAAGDDRTARIRHVIREEKMIGAYDLIEIYCELIVARLPIIESQKTCPMDLKEAIASVIFATPRCSDITELVDVKKNFRAKYGKEFVTAATDLIPGCGVSQMVCYLKVDLAKWVKMVNIFGYVGSS
nr:vacuolar protein sorting-associated protein Ist1 [Tanacetum cinerariifolium]